MTPPPDSLAVDPKLGTEAVRRERVSAERLWRLQRVGWRLLYSSACTQPAASSFAFPCPTIQYVASHATVPFTLTYFNNTRTEDNTFGMFSKRLNRPSLLPPQRFSLHHPQISRHQPLTHPPAIQIRASGCPVKMVSIFSLRDQEHQQIHRFLLSITKYQSKKPI